jgi:hypothetical protein
LPTAGRPAELAHWQKRGRKYSSPPVVTAILQFEDAFETWWAELLQQSQAAKDGGVLQYGGTNGIISILLLLCWWGRAVAHGAEAKTLRWTAWHKCVVEVRDELGKVARKCIKRPLQVEETTLPTSKRYVELAKVRGHTNNYHSIFRRV